MLAQSLEAAGRPRLAVRDSARHAAPRRLRKLVTAGPNASANRSTSLSVDPHPRLNLIAPAASSGATPIAASTCERATLPDEHAEPDDAATPARSSRISSVAAATPGTAKQVVFANRGAPAP